MCRIFSCNFFLNEHTKSSIFKVLSFLMGTRYDSRRILTRIVPFFINVFNRLIVHTFRTIRTNQKYFEFYISVNPFHPLQRNREKMNTMGREIKWHMHKWHFQAVSKLSAVIFSIVNFECLFG